MSQSRDWTRGLTPYFAALLIAGTLGPFLFGYHLAELNAPQDVITCIRKSIRSSASLNLPQCIPMGPPQVGLVTSIFTLGGLVGALAAGPLSARYGRLLPMRYNTAFFIIGPIATALAPNVAVMAIGRFVSGVGAGAALVVVPIWVSEVAPPTEKGFYGVFTQIMINTGIFAAQFLGYFLSYGSMWRIILAIAGLIGLIQLASLSVAVDSPQWNAAHGQTGRAERDLQRIRGRNADVHAEMDSWRLIKQNDVEQREALLHHDRDEARAQLRAGAAQPDTSAVMGFLDVVKVPSYRRAVIAVVVVMLAQQLTGINSIVMYGVSLLSDLLQSNSALLNILVSVLNIVATVASAPMVQGLGRKPCLLLSIGGMGISSILLGIGIRGSMPILSAVAVITDVISFGLGLGPVPFMLASELVGPEAVGATQSWALGMNWAATFVVAQFFPIVNARLGKGITYFLFAALAAVFFAFVVLCIPETKGKRDADQVWGRDTRDGDQAQD